MTGGNIITLSVQFKSGNWVYPIIAGAGCQGGFVTYQVEMPPVESMPGEDVTPAASLGAGTTTLLLLSLGTVPLRRLVGSCFDVDSGTFALSLKVDWQLAVVTGDQVTVITLQGLNVVSRPTRQRVKVHAVRSHYQR